MDERTSTPVYDPAARFERYQLPTPILHFDALTDGEIRELGTVLMGAYVNKRHGTQEKEDIATSLDRKVGASFRAFAGQAPERAVALVSEILADPGSEDADFDTAEELSLGLILAGAAQGFDCLMAVAYIADPEDVMPAACIEAQSALDDFRATGRLTPEQERVLLERETGAQRSSEHDG